MNTTSLAVLPKKNNVIDIAAHNKVNRHSKKNEPIKTVNIIGKGGDHPATLDYIKKIAQELNTNHVQLREINFYLNDNRNRDRKKASKTIIDKNNASNPHSTEINSKQLEQIRLGIKSKVNVNYYSNSRFCWRQMREIRLGLEAGIDVKVYAKTSFSPEQMNILRRELLLYKE
jgi:hypothetical protein